MYILVIAAWFYIYKTRQGLVLRSLGESPQTADALGINVFRLRYFYTCIGSILGALGGAYLTLAYTPLWADKMTSGKGWIALAIVIFATWNPLLVAVGALLFGGVQVLALRMQVAGVGIPSQFLNMLPYLLTLIVLILSTGEIGGKKKGNSIKALGQPYDREDR
jgi:simple sugar transport system permease protein